MGEVGRSAAGQQIDAVEIAERPDHREQGAGEIERSHRRPGDEAEFLPPARAVHIGRLEQIMRDRKPSGHQDQRPERQRFPDVNHNRHRQRQYRVVEPVRTVLGGELEDQLIDHAPFGIEHEAHRQDGRNRRHRPWQDEKHRQPFDPRAFLNKEARQKQRHHHFQVDADQQEKQSVERRAREHRVVVQRDVACRLARQPKSVADRIKHEGEKHEKIRRQQRERPHLGGRQSRRQRSARDRI